MSHDLVESRLMHSDVHEDRWMILHIPVGDRLNYWCIGYIEKIDGGHHRHYEFFIWMLRRLNYRAVRATLLTASYMGPLISAMAENCLAYVQVNNRIIFFSTCIDDCMEHFFALFFTSLKIFATSQSFKFLYLLNLTLFKFASLRIIKPFASRRSCIDQADHNERNKQSIF